MHLEKTLAPFSELMQAAGGFHVPPSALPDTPPSVTDPSSRAGGNKTTMLTAHENDGRSLSEVR